MSNIIDLVQDENGVYVEKKKNKPRNVNKVNHKPAAENCVNPVDAIFMGMDLGIDFISNIADRIRRLESLTK